jgi:hypothetical protein
MRENYGLMRGPTLAVLLVASPVAADGLDLPALPPTFDLPPPPVAAPDPPAIKLGGYVEAFEAFDFARPPNHIINLRAFDDRSGTLTLQNAVIEATWTHGPVSGRIALQAGEAPDLYYGSEPLVPATGTAPANDPTDWRHVQEAWAQWDTGRVQLAAGLFLSPVGTEDLAEKDDWSWSRSNLFLLLPTYHVGARATVPFHDSWKATAAVYNGWNDALNTNYTPCVSASIGYEKADVVAQLLYFGGEERYSGDPDGRPWRHLLDAYVQAPLAHGFSFGLHGDVGTEHGALARSSWQSAAAYLKYDLTSTIWFAGRADFVREPRTAATPILTPVALLASGTLTAAYRPVDGFEVRMDYRHDHANAAAFYGSDIIDRRTQNTATLGMLAWF